MKADCRSKVSTRAGLLFAGMMLVFASSATAEVGYATVKKIQGSAKYSSAIGQGDLKIGQVLTSGYRITTEDNSFVDLHLGVNGDALRIEESSTVTLTELTFRRLRGDTTVVRTGMNVTRGHVVANVVRKLSRSSRYRIRTPSGVAGIRGTCVRAGFTGVLAVIGTVQFTQNNGQVVLVIGGFVMSAGANQPISAAIVRTQGVAAVATASTVNTGTAQMVQQTVQQFAQAIATQAALNSPNAQTATQTATRTAAAVVQALMQAIQQAAQTAPPQIQAQVQQAVQAVKQQVAAVTVTAAANATAIAVVAVATKQGATPQQARQQAQQAAQVAAQLAGQQVQQQAVQQAQQAQQVVQQAQQAVQQAQAGNDQAAIQQAQQQQQQAQQQQQRAQQAVQQTAQQVQQVQQVQQAVVQNTIAAMQQVLSTGGTPQQAANQGTAATQTVTTGASGPTVGPPPGGPGTGGPPPSGPPPSGPPQDGPDNQPVITGTRGMTASGGL